MIAVGGGGPLASAAVAFLGLVAAVDHFAHARSEGGHRRRLVAPMPTKPGNYGMAAVYALVSVFALAIALFQP